MNLINTSIVRTLAGKYWGRAHNNNPTDNLGFGFIHYALIRNIKPESVLSIGSQKGYIPAILAQACMDQGRGHVDFVDASLDDNSPNGWGGVGIWNTVTASYWDEIDPKLKDFITLHVMTTEEFAENTLKVVPNKKFQYIYIDGDHSYKGVFRDFALAVNLADPYEDSFIVLHGVLVDKETKFGRCGVKDFWEQLKANVDVEKRDDLELMTIPYDAGLGIVRVKKKL